MSLEIARALYASLPGRCAAARERFGRPLTFADKILVAHADDFAAQDWTRGRAMLEIVRAVAIDDAAKAGILGGSAARLLGIRDP